MDGSQVHFRVDPTDSGEDDVMLDGRRTSRDSGEYIVIFLKEVPQGSLMIEIQVGVVWALASSPQG